MLKMNFIKYKIEKIDYIENTKLKTKKEKKYEKKNKNLQLEFKYEID